MGFFCSPEGLGQRHICPLISLLFFPWFPYFLELSRTPTATISTFLHFPPACSHTCTTFLCSFHCSCNFHIFLYSFSTLLLRFVRFILSSIFLTFHVFCNMSRTVWKNSFCVGGGPGNPGKRQGNCRWLSAIAKNVGQFGIQKTIIPTKSYPKQTATFRRLRKKRVFSLKRATFWEDRSTTSKY